MSLFSVARRMLSSSRGLKGNGTATPRSPMRCRCRVSMWSPRYGRMVTMPWLAGGSGAGAGVHGNARWQPGGRAAAARTQATCDVPPNKAGGSEDRHLHPRARHAQRWRGIVEHGALRKLGQSQTCSEPAWTRRTGTHHGSSVDSGHCSRHACCGRCTGSFAEHGVGAGWRAPRACLSASLAAGKCSAEQTTAATPGATERLTTGRVFCCFLPSACGEVCSSMASFAGPQHYRAARGQSHVPLHIPQSPDTGSLRGDTPLQKSTLTPVAMMRRAVSAAAAVARR